MPLVERHALVLTARWGALRRCIQARRVEIGCSQGRALYADDGCAELAFGWLHVSKNWRRRNR